jgi:AraC-like DNA-binding protein
MPISERSRETDPSRARCSAATARLITSFAVRRGVHEATLLESVGVTPSEIAPADAQIELGRTFALWREATRLTGDACFGARAGSVLRPELLGTLGLVLLACSTTREAWHKTLRYERLIYSGFRSTTEENATSVTIRHDAEHPAMPIERQPMEYVLSATLAMFRSSSGIQVEPCAVRFRHSAPDDPGVGDELKRIFGVPVEFGAEENAIVLPISILDAPLPAANPALLATLDRFLDSMLVASEGASAVRARLRTFLTGALRGVEPSMEAAAKALMMSERTLQRRLHDEGTTYRDALDEARRAMSFEYLRAQHMSIAEVAFLTGFSETSAFQRAFKRWTGQTPREYRSRATAA